MQYGDLSHLRPVTPPLHRPGQHEDRPILSPGQYVDDVPSKFYTEDGTVDNKEVAQVSEHRMENHCDTDAQAWKEFFQRSEHRKENYCDPGVRAPPFTPMPEVSRLLATSFVDTAKSSSEHHQA